MDMRVEGAKVSKNKNPYKQNPGPNLISFSEFILKLHKGSYSRKELAVHCGICHNTVLRWVRLLSRKKAKFIYISGWRRYSGSTWVALYTWGWNQDDEPRPKPRTTAEHCRNWRARQTKSIEGPIPTKRIRKR